MEFPEMTELIGHVECPKDWVLDGRALCDLELLLNGAMLPLCGYLSLNDYKSCLEEMRLEDGSVWPIPIVLPIPVHFINQGFEGTVHGAQLKRRNKKIKLRDQTNALIAELSVNSVYRPNLEREKLLVLGPDNENHPYSKYLNENYRNCFYVGGTLAPLHRINHFDYQQYRLSPAEVKKRLLERGWKHVVGFQTRNPMHRSHYEVTMQALKDIESAVQETAHLMITPTIGPTQPGDIDFRIRIRSYERILAHYEEEPLLILLPIAMRMAGPREAVWHSIIRKNYGCSHFIVGRDHAGPSTKRSDGSSFYGMYDAQQLVLQFAHEIGIQPVLAKNMVYCGADIGYCQETQVPHGIIPHTISGTNFRELLIKQLPVPEWFCFQDVAEELRRAYRPVHEQGLCVYFTGLPCAGKSTLACALETVMLESKEETRKVTVLDADIIRTHLSKGLGFSRVDRSLNVRRIGYVASEIVKHGGICLVANIAPYAEDREFNRRLIESAGGTYVEVHVSTPLAVCESRDIKELYKKARMGVIKQFTGISDPYEMPSNPDVTINSSENAHEKVVQVFHWLQNKGLVLGP